MAGLIGNTDASGQVGGKVAALLAARGHRQRLIVPDAAKAPVLPGAEISILADESDSPALQAALADADTVFLVPVRERPDRVAVHRGAVGAAVAAGVRHIVYSSFLSAAPDATFTWARDHYATEEHIRSTGVPFTFLRGSVYLEVLHYAVGPDQTIHAPAATGGSPRSHARTWHGWRRQCWPRPPRTPARPMTSPGRRRFPSRSWRRRSPRRGETPVGYADQDVTEALALARASGMPEWQAQGWVSALHQVSTGELDIISDTIRTLTGRRPVSLAEFLGQHSRLPGGEPSPANAGPDSVTGWHPPARSRQSGVTPLSPGSAATGARS
jgi:NAD(P)H dehydrogenase (quinone)